MRQTRARMEGRVGAGVLQPWRDVRKLLAKEPLRAAGQRRPDVVDAAAADASRAWWSARWSPSWAPTTLTLMPDDLFVVVSVLLLGTVALALLGLEAGHRVRRDGFEPAHDDRRTGRADRARVGLCAVDPGGDLGPVGDRGGPGRRSRRVVSPVSLLAVVALAIAVLAETGRLPVDNPSTHLELTMVHEAMVLESSGPRPGLARAGVLAATHRPARPGRATWWCRGGLPPSLSLTAVLVGVVAIALKLLVAGVLVAAGEVFLAKLRLFRVPELLAGSFVLAFLAVTASYLIGSA